MTIATGTGTAKEREMTQDEQHFLSEHMTIVFDKEHHRLHIGFAHACEKAGCPAGKELSVALYRCPSKPCPPAYT